MAQASQFQEVHVDQFNLLVVPAAASLSPIFDCGGTTLCGFIADEQLSGLNVFFNVSNRPGTSLSALYDGSATPAPVQFTLPAIGPGQTVYTYIPPIIFAGVKYIQFSLSSSVAADSTIELCVRPT